jgi:hypothetical protein
VEKHFIIFASPGTFFPETTERPIDSWDVAKAIKMSHTVLERYNARPYGFYFSTRSRRADDLDSRETAKSNFYYLGGKIETKAEVFARNDPEENVLRANMECNSIDRIIINDNSWRFTGPLRDTDVVLDYEPAQREITP